MNSRKPAELLQSDNPEDRKQGIRLVAQMRSEKALKVLVKFYKQDPDEDVREIAKRAASHVSQKLREAENAPPEPEPDADQDEPDEDEAEEDLGPVEVSPQNKKRADGYMGAAMDHQANADRQKAITALKKALDANPNLRTDSYFQSMAAAITGMEPDEAVRALRSDKKRERLIQAEANELIEAEQAEHMAQAQKHTWETLAIDIGLFVLILFMGGLLSVLVIEYGAGVQIDQLQAEIEQLQNPVDDEGNPATPPEDAQQQIAQAEARLTIAGLFADGFGPVVGLTVGLALVMAFVPGVIVMGYVLNPISQRLFNGEGTTHYTIFNLLSAYNMPMIAIFAVVIIGAILIFLVGVPLLIGLGIVAGLVSLISLIITLRVIGATAKAYNFGFVQALIAVILANIPVSIFQSIVAGVVSGILGAIIGPIIAATGAL